MFEQYNLEYMENFPSTFYRILVLNFKFIVNRY